MKIKHSTQTIKVSFHSVQHLLYEISRNHNYEFSKHWGNSFSQLPFQNSKLNVQRFNNRWRIQLQWQSAVEAGRPKARQIWCLRIVILSVRSAGKPTSATQLYIFTWKSNTQMAFKTINVHHYRLQVRKRRGGDLEKL